MLIKEVKFVKSVENLEHLPNEQLPEYAFIGRTNVGKSSLINYLFNKKNAAKISSTPGKTKLISYFKINNEFFIVDLPGYGFAKVSKKEQIKWKELIFNFLLIRKTLTNVFLLIDCHILAQEIDLKMLRFLGINKIPFSIIFTKIDKVSKQKLNSYLEKYKNILLKEWEKLPDFFLVSSLRK